MTDDAHIKMQSLRDANIALVQTGMSANLTSVNLGTVMWDGKPVISDDRDEGDGSAPVREPRRPRRPPLAPAAAAAIPFEREMVTAGR